VGPVELEGRWCRVEPVAARHLPQLYDALVLHSPPSIWTYLAVGPFEDPAGFHAWLRELHDDAGAFPHAICRPDGRPVGVAAFLRLGFRYEGAFRNAVVYKGRNRDTAWFSITDEEWTAEVRPRFEAWLAASNFDDDGRQRTPIRG
jgi:RimJ/RimL family protein N-acetyltransferase